MYGNIKKLDGLELECINSAKEHFRVQIRARFWSLKEILQMKEVGCDVSHVLALLRAINLHIFVLQFSFAIAINEQIKTHAVHRLRLRLRALSMAVIF